MHTGQSNNGIVFSKKDEAIIVSTPESEEETQNLIDYVNKELKLKIIGYIIDRWHPDAMGGLKAVHSAGIKTYANELTQNIAREKGLPVPQVGFKTLLKLHVGGEDIIADYLEPAHTEDGIVVWIPKDRILFGGNEVRNMGGWYGNIGDANLEEWSETIFNVKEKYGDAKIVIPGHGQYGGADLLDYTLNLYRKNKWGAILKKGNIEVAPVFNDYGDIFEIAKSDSIVENKRYLKDAIVFVNHSQKYLKITSPEIVHDVNGKEVYSDIGRLQLYNHSNELIDDLYYKKLWVNLRNDEVEWTIIITEAIR
ncbi:MAG: hypothetical protein LBV71_05705 [Prevotella sp.]|nr:hypothetical protein [Prevotella sp.]